MPATLCRAAVASLVLLGSASPAAWAQDEILVPNFSNGAVVVHGRTTTGDAIPLRALFGSATRLDFPAHAVLDPVHDELFVANIGTPKAITVYARTASGNLAALRTLSGPAATLIEPIALALDLVHDELFVANDVGDFVAVYARTASGDTAPRRTLTGPATGLSSPVGLLVDLAHDELVVANRETVTVYPRAATGNVAPLRTLVVGTSGLGPPGPGRLALDLVHDELVVAGAGSSIRVYPRTATGGVAALRTLAGPSTGLNVVNGVAVDLLHDELLVANGSADSITAYPRTASGDVAPLRTLAGALTGLRFPEVPVLAVTPPLAAAVLPTSRSVQVGSPAGAFATIINAGGGPAQGCAPSPLTSVPAIFTFQTTDARNQLVGTPNTPANIPAGGAQSFVFGFTPTDPFGPTEVELGFACVNTIRAVIITGVNTLLTSASLTPVPDLIAAVATLANDGIVNIPGATGTGVFAVGTFNVGAPGTITISADTGGASLPVTLTLCETVPATGECLAAPATSITIPVGSLIASTFGVFVAGSGVVPFDPATNRIFVRFQDAGGTTRGSTSVAVRTE